MRARKLNRRFHILYNQILAEPVPYVNAGTSLVLWKYREDDFQDNFSARDTWEQIRPRNEKVHWSKMVWFKKGVPRYAFIAWLTIFEQIGYKR